MTLSLFGNYSNSRFRSLFQKIFFLPVRLFFIILSPSSFAFFDANRVQQHVDVCKVSNRVGGKRSSFLPTFVFRPLTPPYVPFGIRRFFTMDAFRILRKTLPRHLLQPSICRSALLYTLRIPSYLFKGSPILLFWFYAFVPTNGSFQLCRLNKVWSFPIGIHALGTTTSADFSRQALLHHGTSNHSSSPYVRETSSDKGINFQSYVCSIYTNRPE